MYSDRATDLKIIRKDKLMIKKYKVTYRAVKNHRSVVMIAFSEQDAKQRFLNLFPEKDIVSVEEIKNESKAT